MQEPRRLSDRKGFILRIDQVSVRDVGFCPSEKRLMLSRGADLFPGDFVYGHKKQIPFGFGQGKLVHPKHAS
jgi:hypothetical protein